jgi:glucose dehydrogenase
MLRVTIASFTMQIRAKRLTMKAASPKIRRGFFRKGMMCAATLAMVSLCGPVWAQTNTGWTVYNGGLDGDHYSKLAQINRANVKQLKVAWTFDTGEQGGIQDNPLIVGRTLYAYTPTQKIVALDAATGKLKWKYDSGIGGTQPVRGMTWWEDSGRGRVFAGIMNFLYCLDAETGKPVETFGEQGRIDLRKELRGNYEEQSIVLTTPGVIYKDLIIVGGRNPETHPAPPGDIRAFDVRTGKLRWSFHTIPHPGEPGYETWPPEAWKTAGAANNWPGMALDAQRGIVYAPTGSAVFDFYGGDRLGNDLYANTLLALDANTGKRLWHFQGVHHDIWDRDFPSEPALFTVKRDGKTIDALAQTTKQGYLYLFDRVTGQPLFPIHELPYPASTVPGEVTSPTQPKPDAPEPFARQRLTADSLTTRTPEANAWAVNQFKNLRSDGQFLPFALDKLTVIFPGFDGGAEWGGPAIDPATDVLYVNASEMAWLGGLIPATQGGGPGAQVYESQCAMCHGPDRSGAPPAFPSLVNVLGRLTVEQVTGNIKKGNGRMPSFPNIDDAKLNALIEFLRTGSTTSKSDAPKELGSVPVQQMTAQAPADKAGAAIYQDHCAICHGDHMEGIAPAFPMLVGVGDRLTRAQIVDMIQNGKNQMPPMPDMKGDDLGTLLHYMGVAEGTTTKTLYGDYDQEKYVFTGYHRFLDPEGYPAVGTPWGTLNAIDLKTGKYLWKIPLGEYPELVAKGLKNTGSENYGGPIVTAGGVLFIGATIYDRKFRAFDTRDGKLLWETELPFSGVATPSTYMVDGKQYVVIGASAARDPKAKQGGAYVAFALPK